MKMPSVLHDTVHLKGGWDTQTPTLDLPPGFVRDALNYECGLTGGYNRIAGYERFDGRPAPSSAAYTNIFVDAFANIPAIGDTIKGITSLATGYVFDVDPASFRITITKTTGSFNATEAIQIVVGALPVGNRVAQSAALATATSARLASMAADVYRSDIKKVGDTACTGVARGYVLYSDIVYAFRENAASTNVLLYKSSSTGWVSVPYYNELYFVSTGASAPAEGSTITQGAVTATIKRVVLQSGAWGTNAGGKFIITNPAGGNFTTGALAAPNASITVSGAQVPITFSVQTGSKFEFDVGNFSGGTSTQRVYGCDGANRAFEFDGDVLVPIDSLGAPNLSIDKPKHIVIHKKMLFLAIGSSLIYSAPGLPYNFQALSYAGAIAAGQTLTGLKVMPGSTATGTLLVTSRDNTFMLYGTTPADFNFVSYNTGAGAIDFTVQNMSDTYVMDDRGVVSLKTTLNYGNFDQATLTYQISKFIEQNRTLVSSSSLNRRKSQYRIFFTSGYALYITSVNGELRGAMPVAFPVPVYMVDEGKFSNGEEASFFCGTDGFVYRMDKGTSFDGDSTKSGNTAIAINAYITLKYHSASSPRQLKRYRKAAVEVSGSGYCVLNFGYSLGYGSSNISQDNYSNYDASTATFQWDNFTWDNFVWDGNSITPSECEMTGTGENIAITIRSNSPYFQEHLINSIIVHYSNRRALR